MNPNESEYSTIVQSLYNIPLIGGITGSVTQSDFIYTSTETGIPLLYCWHNGKKEIISPPDEPVMGSRKLHGKSPRAIYAKDTSGDENYYLYVTDYSKHSIQKITEEPIGRLSKLFWYSDTEWIVIGCDKQEYYIKVISQDGQNSLYSTHEQIMAADYDDTRQVLVVAVGRGAGTKLALINVTNNTTDKNITWISESDTSEDTFPCIYSGTGHLAYTTNVSGHIEIVVRSLEDLDEVCRVCVPGDIGFLPGTATLVWVNENTMLCGVAKHAQISPRLVTIPGGEWSDPLIDGSVLGGAKTKSGIILHGSSLSQPHCIQRLHNKKVVTLIKPDYKNFCPGESHWYTSFDGRKIQGWLLRSSHPGAPLLVYCHGGPNFATLNMWRPDVQALVQGGYHVFAPNFRGSTTFGSEFRDLNIKDLGGGDLKDVLYGAIYAAEILGTTENPAITGGSYGGYLTLMALTLQPDEWQGGVSLIPMVDLVETYEQGDAHYKAFFKYLLGGTPQENPELYKEQSPITHLENLVCPVLIIAGENDPRCPVQPIQTFYEKAKNLNLPVDLEVIPEEGHGAAVVSNMMKMNVLQLEFLKTLF
ncbi:MAG: alpha/beta fold hydrolase [Candidatus Methanofastidiosia archaeon]|jgi:pimeloyl-ACP methyl ester carboxylesterase